MSRKLMFRDLDVTTIKHLKLTFAAFDCDNIKNRGATELKFDTFFLLARKV